MATYVALAPPLKHVQMTRERVEKFISPIYFKDINLHSRLIKATQEAESIARFECSHRFGYAEALSSVYVPAKIGESFGPLFGTHWFRVTFDIKNDWLGEEVLFVWNSSSEATLWSDGQPIGAFSGENPFGLSREYYVISTCLDRAGRMEFLIEMACNGMTGDGDGGFIQPPNPNAKFVLKKCHLATRNRSVYSLLLDLNILHDMAKELQSDERGFLALFTANSIVNTLQCGDFQQDAIDRCQEETRKFLSQHNGALQHTLHAIGHCHIDCAWLWPVDETKRKCARSWAATLDLLDRYPSMKFVASSAQQYAWVQHHYPLLFDRIRQQVIAGRFIPVGGVWVEMDGNIPSGEAMCRQLLYGQRYFLEEFGALCTEFWLPDTFGYSIQMPQIVNHFGMKRFVTQKLSWNLFNKFPHNTFKWRGLDGSELITHFAPGDSYHMDVKVNEMLHTVANFKDKGRSRSSLFLYGHGDGGQGPTQDMLENLSRLSDMDGLPRMKHSTPRHFFEEIETNEKNNLCTWVGELYLEMHTGTYTTQAKIKQFNRLCEVLLHNIEFVASVAYAGFGHEYPKAQIHQLWKNVLLNQFHDILPGSSIELVNEQARYLYEETIALGTPILNALLCVLVESAEQRGTMLFNTRGWNRLEVITVETADAVNSSQKSTLDHHYCLVWAPSFGVAPLEPLTPTNPCSISIEDGLIVLSNGKLSAALDELGRVVDLRVKSGDVWSRNTLNGPANQLVIYGDIPLFWDAWDVMDYHQETRQPLTSVLSRAAVCEKGPLRVSVEVTIKISDRSYVKQTVSLDAESPFVKFSCEAHWHENRKLLKVEFPLDMKSDHVTYESQFGHVKRSNHRNTTWDSAKYEVCCQSWFDLSEFEFGVAILNDCKYGCSAIDSTVYLSLLRAPKYPDASADMGTHYFAYAIMPHYGSLQTAGVIQQAHALNSPLLVFKGSARQRSFFYSSNEAVVIDTVKIAEDCDDHLVLRAYEAFGSSCEVSIYVLLPVSAVYSADGMERQGNALKWNVDTKTFACSFRPFQIHTFLIKLDRGIVNRSDSI